jgi:hypothetical protein
MYDIDLTSRDGIADWIETSVLARNNYIGFDALDAAIKQELNVTEATISFAVAAMAKREELLGPQYPFKVSPLSITPRVDANKKIYTSLLLMSADSPGRRICKTTTLDELSRIFEKIVVQAMQRLLGPRSQAVRFGWPSDDGRPQNFHQAIDWLSNKMGILPGNAYRPPLRKDGGVDVVAWRPFRDRRSGFPVLLVQCTLQRDLLPKSHDIDVRNWAGWLTLDADPATVLATPATIPSAQSWNLIAIRSLILDRIRICELLDDVQTQSIPGAEVAVAKALAELTTVLKAADI